MVFSLKLKLQTILFFLSTLFIPMTTKGANHPLSPHSAFLSEKTWRFDFSGSVLKRQSNESLFSFPELGIIYSVVKKVELSAFWPFLILTRTNRPALASSGDINLSTKVALYARKNWAAAFRFWVKLPNAQDEKKLGTDQTDFFSAVLFSERIRSFEFSQNFGLGILGSPTALRSQEDVYPFGLSATIRPKKLAFFSEWYGQASPHPAYVFSRLSAGVGYEAGKFAFKLSALKGLTEKPKGYQNLLGADWGVNLGFQWFRK